MINCNKCITSTPNGNSFDRIEPFILWNVQAYPICSLCSVITLLTSHRPSKIGVEEYACVRYRSKTARNHLAMQHGRFLTFSLICGFVCDFWRSLVLPWHSWSCRFDGERNQMRCHYVTLYFLRTCTQFHIGKCWGESYKTCTDADAYIAPGWGNIMIMKKTTHSHRLPISLCMNKGKLPKL